MCCNCWEVSSLHEINIPVDYCQQYNQNVDPPSTVLRSDVKPTRTRIKVTLSTGGKYKEYKVSNRNNFDSSKRFHINNRKEIFVVDIQYTLVVLIHPVYYQDQTQEGDQITNQSLIITAVPLWILNLTSHATSFPRKSGTQLHPVSLARSRIQDCKIWDLGLQYIGSGITIAEIS